MNGQLKRCLASALLLVGAFSLNASHAAPPQDLKGTNVVLVHGAFADGSSWDKVIPLLQARGLHVVAVQNPLSSLADDTAATQRAIDQQTGPVVLVGHSWGGAVITQAGNEDKVRLPTRSSPRQAKSTNRELAATGCGALIGPVSTGPLARAGSRRQQVREA